MPPLTHQGLNTFGCYIDGQLFVAKGGDAYWDLPPVSGSFNEVTGQLNLLGKRYINLETNESDDIIIYSKIKDGAGEYALEYNDDGGSVGYRNWFGGKCTYYYRENTELDIGSLINENCENGDTILNISHGRFDFKY
jgi:hypothetical protein